MRLISVLIWKPELQVKYNNRTETPNILLIYIYTYIKLPFSTQRKTDYLPVAKFGSERSNLNGYKNIFNIHCWLKRFICINCHIY